MISLKRILTTLCFVVVSSGLGLAQSVTVVSGDGQLVNSVFQTTEPLKVVVKNSAGVPIPSAVVTWTIIQGQGSISNNQTVTDVNGETSINFIGPPLFQGTSAVQSYVNANAFGASVNFTMTTVFVDPATGTAQVGVQLIYPSLADLPLTGPAGSSGSIPIQVRVQSIFGQGLAGISVRLVQEGGITGGPSISCATAAGTVNYVLTDGAGNASCTPRFGGSLGNGTFTVSVGGQYRIFSGQSFRVTAGQFSSIRITNGNNQSAGPGERLPSPFVAQTEDAAGNIIANVPVVWEVVTANGGTLSNQVTTSDSTGRVSANLTLGTGVTGAVQVRVSSAVNANINAVFTATVNIVLRGIEKTSGDNQEVIINSDSQPLVVTVRSDRGVASGVQVSFAVTSGGADPLTPTATTDANGRAQTVIRVRNNPGTIAVTASVTGFSVSFSLTARLPGPQFTSNSFFSAASGQAGGVSPSALVTVFGTGWASGIQGCVTPNQFLGPFSTQVAQVQIDFGGIQAPIYAVCNNGPNNEYVVIQVPVEVPLGSATVTGKVGSGSTTVQGVQVVAAAPGIFETLMSDNRKRLLAVRPNGSFMSLENRAQRGEILRIYVSGLGPAVTTTGAQRIPTNQLGILGNDGVPPYEVVVGVNNEGVPNVLAAVYSRDLLGIYIISFVLPGNTPSGTNIPFAVASIVNGNFVFGNPSSLPVQ